MTDYVFDRLVEAVNTVVVIEHNLDVIKRDACPRRKPCDATDAG